MLIVHLDTEWGSCLFWTSAPLYGTAIIITIIIATMVKLSYKTETTKNDDDDDDDDDDDHHHHHIYGATFCPVALYGAL